MKPVHPRKLALAALAALALLWPGARALACVTPVFQFALENWEPDRYEVTIMASGGLDPAQQAAADLLLRAAQPKGAPANIEVKTAEPADKTPDAFAPRFEVRFPSRHPDGPAIWTAHLTPQEAQAVLDSPARREIIRLLLDSKTAVWVLLECKDRRKNERAAKTLQTALARLEQTLAPPEGADSPPIAFALARVRPDDPAERFFVQTLLHTERDLAGLTGGPIVFPIYGRGRALYALAGQGISEWNIAQAAEFLVGPCSCLAKASHPGVDLLLSADWEASVKPLSRPVSDAPGGLGSFLERKAEAERRLAPQGETREDAP